VKKAGVFDACFAQGAWWVRGCGCETHFCYLAAAAMFGTISIGVYFSWVNFFDKPFKNQI
jgi:hypothetical protein